jgi:hypothetical protein
MIESPDDRQCPNCYGDLDKKGICWACYEQEFAEDQGSDDLDGTEALALAKELAGSLQFTLQLFGYHGLAKILADSEETAALRTLIITNDEGTLKALSKLGNSRFFKSKRGPQRKNGLHHEEIVLQLRREGKTNAKIAKILGISKNAVAAAYSNITNKIATHQAGRRGQ